MTVANDNEPLVLTRAQAAERCSIALSTFDAWVRRGVVPRPLPGTRRWSRVALDHALAGGAFHTLPAAAAVSPFEQWKASRAG
ncbi:MULTISPECIES: hypothetical protein [unclassified Chelatococcus]|uniref:helix-turn-helix transcriptional regulator n=1 Tax=unclassified Chelatococcus TaxID=2638111 RepID=UPI001BCB5D89|nr:MULTISPECIES: hypothetical protein [unclassified Chelatococcus]MBS7697560.1 hypothetical protein [Chelatococcus sp. YT9]MBX3559365.1 hypothetical protein [Chelatococcus sp.]